MKKQCKYYVVKVGSLYSLRLTEFRDRYEPDFVGTYTTTLEEMRETAKILAHAGVDLSEVENVQHA